MRPSWSSRSACRPRALLKSVYPSNDLSASRYTRPSWRFRIHPMGGLSTGWLQAAVERVDQRAVARVLPSGFDRVHHVAERDTGGRVGEPERAAGAEVAEARRVRTERAVGASELEAEAERRLAAEDRAPTIGLHSCRLVERRSIEDGDALDGATRHEGPVHACDPTRVRVHVCRRD